MGKVIMSGIVPQLTVPSAGTPISEFAVGSTVKMNVNGTQKDFLIVHHGLPSSMYDSSCNGAWLLMKDIYELRAWGGSNKNYSLSDIHNYLNGDFLTLFDESVQNIIPTVKIPYTYVNMQNNAYINSGANGLSAQIFLLSGYEVGWTTSNHRYFPVDGSCLSYFSGLSSMDEKRLGYLDGAVKNWWLRSPNTNANTTIWLVQTQGSYGAVEPTNSYGIRPALILPSTALVKDDGTVKGAA